MAIDLENQKPLTMSELSRAIRDRFGRKVGKQTLWRYAKHGRKCPRFDGPIKLESMKTPHGRISTIEAYIKFLYDVNEAS